MHVQEYVVYRSFNDLAIAEELVQQLQKANIPYEIEKPRSIIDPLIIGESLDPDILIKLRREDFSRADQIVEEAYKKHLNDIPADYYLFEFTEEELQEILQRPGEWGKLDYLLAEKILKEKGKVPDPETLAMYKWVDLKQSATQEAVQTQWVVLGYVLAVLFPPIGLMFGATIYGFRKTLSDGTGIYMYNARSRWHALFILIISSVLTAMLFILKLNFSHTALTVDF
jgi:hypothetical protein